MPEFEADSVFVDFGFVFVSCGFFFFSLFILLFFFCPVGVDGEIAKSSGNRTGVAEELPG